ncbi:MAG: NusG domain II-containing protein [Clostridiales bacterium]|nr:NusG domain II-containing protein [Clostridiales bacterium]
MKKDRQKRQLLRKGDMLIIAVLLAVVCLLLLVTRYGSRPGAAAVVTTPEETFSLPLNVSQVCELKGRGGIPVVLEIGDGQIRFQSSSCPDRLCVNSGWLSHAGQSAACVPAGIAVRLIGAPDDGVDAVTA